MAVVDIVETKPTTATQDGSATTATRSFIVQTDAGGDNALDGLFAIGIPRIGSLHPDNAILICSNKGTNQLGPFTWEVICNYSSGVEIGKFIDDPRQRKPDVAWTFFQTEEVVQADNNETPIANSAGDFFLDPITRQVSNLEVTIQRNENITSYNPSKALEFMGSVNSSSTTIAGLSAGKHEAKLENYSAVQMRLNGIDYWRVTYRVRFNLDTWEKQILDAGFNKLDPGGKGVKILDANGQPVNQPGLLDGAGDVLADGADAEFLIFEVYPEKEFSELGLNNVG